MYHANPVTLLALPQTWFYFPIPINLKCPFTDKLVTMHAYTQHTSAEALMMEMSTLIFVIEDNLFVLEVNKLGSMLPCFFCRKFPYFCQLYCSKTYSHYVKEECWRYCRNWICITNDFDIEALSLKNFLFPPFLDLHHGSHRSTGKSSCKIELPLNSDSLL